MGHSVKLITGLLLTPPLMLACALSLFEAGSRGARPTAASPELPTTRSAAASSPTSNGAQPSSIPSLPATSVATAVPPGFCASDAPRNLIAQFREVIINQDGERLASLVSPSHGMDARLFRDGRIVNYDRTHAAALFDSSFSLDWGNAPGSDLPAVGSFRQLVVPDLLDVLSREYLLGCNQILIGGATYTASWPYSGIDFYSLYYPGSDHFGKLDWHTWLVGMHDVSGKPYLYAILQFRWEP